MTISVSAAGDAFVPSISEKDGPQLVAGQSAVVDGFYQFQPNKEALDALLIDLFYCPK